MRKLIIAMAALASAAPALGQPHHDPRDAEIVRQLPHPGEIERMGDAIGRTTEALMDIDIGPIADAMDPYHRRYRHGRRETLGDIASRRDPYARERIRDEIGAISVGLGAAAHQLAVMTPVLRHSLEEAIRGMEEAIARSRHARPYDRDYDRRHDDRYDPRDERDYDPDHDPR